MIFNFLKKDILLRSEAMNYKNNIFNKYSLNLWLSILLSFFLVACSENNNSRSIKSLVVAVVPHQDKVRQRKIYEPLIKHINEHTQLQTTLLIPDSYEQLLDWFVNKKIDLAMFGGVTYVKAHLKSNATALVMRDVDSRFKSIVLTHSKSSAKNLNDLKGATFSFGSRLSTSGHFMPRHFFQKNNIMANSFFSDIKYSGAHDRTAEWIRDGKVDAGVVNAGIAYNMFNDKRLTTDKVKVIWESPPFADYVWAIQADISEKQKTLIRDAFLHMNQDEEDIKILKNLGAKYFIPASHEDFIDLEKIILKIEKDH